MSRKLSKKAAAARAEVIADLRADMAAGWTLGTNPDGPVDLSALRDAIGDFMSKEERRRQRHDAFRQTGDM